MFEKTRLFIYLRKILRLWLDRRGYRVQKIGPYSVFDFESFLYRYLEVHKTLTFLQIGANDGRLNDPIFRFNFENTERVSGFVLEPLPEVFANLEINYSYTEKVKAFNLAIHNTATEMNLYRVKPERSGELADFAKGIASFDSEHWKKSKLVPDISFMESVLVKCISLNNFLDANKITNLDLLVLDTEGFDFEILFNMDFGKIKPKIIRFEHGIRDGVMSTGNFKILCTKLNEVGYQIIAESYDATAYLLDPLDLVF